MKKLLILLGLFGCGQQEISSTFKEPIDPINDPKWLPGAVSSLEYVFNKLPDSAEVSRLWTGYWWPMSEGGTSSTRFGSPSPMKKYDLATGATSANEWEISDAKVYARVSWAGHCNGASAAGIMVEEPTKAVTYNNVVFSVIDVKALLAEAWQGSGFIIGNRCDNTRVTYDRYGRINEVACRDVNPGTFHIALANYLGLFGKAIIADMDNSEQVWNYPIEAYTILTKKPLTKDEATWHVQNTTSSAYVFNADAIDFMYVKMSVTFLGFEPKVYEYVLEIGLNGKILGGEWLGSSKTNHPDFIWRPQDPKAENPILDLDIINTIYKHSI